MTNQCRIIVNLVVNGMMKACVELVIGIDNGGKYSWQGRDSVVQ